MEFKFGLCLICSGAFLFLGQSYAVTCTITPSSVSVGQTGSDVNNLFVYDENGVAYKLGTLTEERVKQMYATAMLALSMGGKLRMDWWSITTSCTDWNTRYASANLSYVQFIK